jgi:acyl-CoA synthetase (AMP-forming)/AMP-acid ligase II
MGFRAGAHPNPQVRLRGVCSDPRLISIVRYRITTLLLVPSLIHQLVYHPAMDQHHDFSSLNTVVSAAAYLPPSLAAQLEQKLTKGRKRDQPKLEIIERYGLTEATIGVLFPAPPQPEDFGHRRNKTAMFLVPGLEGLLLVNETQWRAARPGEPGELFVRGKNIALGYLNNEQAAKDTFEYTFDGVGGGWLRTGDRVRNFHCPAHET